MLGDSETTEAANALLVEVSASGEVQVIGGNTSVTSPTTTADDSDDADTAHTSSKSTPRSEEHTSELQSPCNLVCRLLLEKKKNKQQQTTNKKQKTKTKKKQTTQECKEHRV